MDRKIRVRDQEGNIKHISSDDLEQGKIIQEELDENLLTRVGLVFAEIKDVLISEAEKIGTLEQFEMLFMRSDDPEKDIETWEDIVRSYKLAQKYFGPREEIRRIIFRILMFYVVDALSDEENEREDVKLIKKIYDNLRK
jgi:hypothetical protein